MYHQINTWLLYKIIGLYKIILKSTGSYNKFQIY